MVDAGGVFFGIVGDHQEGLAGGAAEAVQQGLDAAALGLIETVQRLGAALPAGMALRCLSAAVRGAGGGVWPLLAWVPVFLLLSAAVRALRARLTGGAE